MRRPLSRESHDKALSEVVGVTLMVILVIALAAVLASIFFGVIVLTPKSAYIAAQAEAKSASAGNWYISVYESGGDTVYLNGSPVIEGTPVNIRVIPPGGEGVYPAIDGSVVWKPGQTLFVYDSSGLKISTDEESAKAGNGLEPKGVWRLEVVDVNSHVLIYTEEISVGVGAPTGVPTTPASPTFTSITPSSGPAAGGTTVTITGTNLAGATGVTIGGTAATSFAVVNSSSITAVTPAHAAGVVSVVITTPGGTASGTNAYTYVSGPTFASIAPSSGPTSGGTTVTITGTNFVSGGSFGLTIGGVAATGVTRNSATQITAVTPAGTAGAKNVVIINNDGQAVTATNAYTYYAAAPVLNSISPSTGNRGWPVTVTLTGSGFQPGAAVYMDRSGGFSGLTGYDVVVISPTQITCKFNLLLVIVDNNWFIHVTNPGGLTSGSIGFAVTSPRPTISTCTPGSGSRGTSVTITDLSGNYFQPGATVVFRRSSTNIPLTNVNVVSASQISGTLVIPAGAPNGAYDIIVTNTDTGSRTGNNKFTVNG